jgi:hypothetical protein
MLAPLFNWILANARARFNRALGRRFLAMVPLGYSAGVMMAKAFLGLDLEVSARQVDARSGQRDLPEQLTDVDLADLIQAVVAQEPRVRMSAAAATSHRALDPGNFLRRQGLLGASRSGATAEALLASAEQLREEFYIHGYGRLFSSASLSKY